MIAATSAAVLSGCSYERNEDENRAISNGIKLIANAAYKRGCISNDERSGLFSLNGVLKERNSTHRIVMWQLPTVDCREK